MPLDQKAYKALEKLGLSLAKLSWPWVFKTKTLAVP